MIEQSNPERSEITLPRVLRAPSGWVLEDLCRLDALHPGFLRRATEARTAWRHAVALAIANGLFDHADRFLARCVPDDISQLSWPEILTLTAAAIMEMKPAQIVEASFGSCPDGLVGSLSKLGFDPLGRDAFTALYAVFADPQHTRRRKVIEQLKVLDQGLFEAAMISDLALISPKLVGRLRHGAGAEKFNKAVAILRRHVSTATDAALAKSLADIGPEMSVRDWSRSWLSRADSNLPSPPWRGGEGLIHLRDGEMLRMAGLKTKTCIESRIGQVVVTGQAAYYLEPEAGVIACVVRTTDGWLATQVVGYRNGRVPKPVRDRVLGILERNGVPVFRPIEDVDGIAFAVGGYLHGRLDEFDLTHLMDEFEAN